jgi:hypothetical protein
MQNKYNNVKISTFLLNLSNMQKYAHSNFRSDIMAPRYLTTIEKIMQILEVPKPNNKPF